MIGNKFYYKFSKSDSDLLNISKKNSYYEIFNRNKSVTDLIKSIKLNNCINQKNSYVNLKLENNFKDMFLKKDLQKFNKKNFCQYIYLQKFKNNRNKNSKYKQFKSLERANSFCCKNLLSKPNKFLNYNSINTTTLLNSKDVNNVIFSLENNKNFKLADKKICRFLHYYFI